MYQSESSPMNDFSARRIMMVDTQVRPSDVTKFPIIAAMLAVSREVYVPDAQREAAYAGQNLHYSARRVMLEARTQAKMLDALDIQPGDHVLDIGCGMGYSAALLSALTKTVVAVEQDAALFAAAQAILADAPLANITLIAGDLAMGAAAHGPYDAITVQGGVEVVPDAILAQLKDGGKIAAVFMQGSLGTVKIGHKLSGKVNWRFAFNAGAPVLPGFEMAHSFAL